MSPTSRILVAAPRSDIVEALFPVAGVADIIEWVPGAVARRGADGDLHRIQMLIWPYPTPTGITGQLALLPSLRFVQGMTAGFESILPHLPPGVMLANAAGVHATSTSEMALALILASRRSLPGLLAAQGRAEWAGGRQRYSLADSRVLIVGVGSIGTAIMQRLLPFEVTITRVARSARVDEHGPVHAVTELPELLPSHDIVVLMAPLNDATRGIADQQFLASMPDGALLVNMARGGLVETDSLVAELESGRIQAALDVTDPEPLPTDHPLWRCPGVIITPHVGGNSAAGPPRLHSFLRDQVRRFAAGEKPINLVAVGVG